METPATESLADQSKEVARIAAFSDGVFAIAITLLTLQLEIPKGGDLAQELMDLQPDLLAFVISFLVVGTYFVASLLLLPLPTGRGRSVLVAGQSRGRAPRAPALSDGLSRATLRRRAPPPGVARSSREERGVELARIACLVGAAVW